MVAQGEVWWMEVPDAGRRPCLVLTRNEAIPVLHNVVVAPITRTLRAIPSCLALGTEDGLPAPSVASFDNLAAVPKSVLSEKIGEVSFDARYRLCVALEAMAGC